MPSLLLEEGLGVLSRTKVDGAAFVKNDGLVE